MKKLLSGGVVLGTAAFFFWVCWQIATSFDFPTFKRWFYTIALMAIFFYGARALRAVAKYFEAKANKEAK
jgi:hypothetical protein